MNLIQISKKTGMGLLESARFLKWLPPPYRRSPILNCSDFVKRAFWGLLVIVYGVMRIGKTYTVLALAEQIRRRFNCEFYSNTPCQNATLFEPTELIKIEPKGSVIVFDETHVYYNPRRSMSKGTLDLLNWITQFGKSDNIMFCISQRFKGIDVWIRDIAHLTIELKRKGVALCESDAYDYPSKFVLWVDCKPPKYDSKAILTKN